MDSSSPPVQEETPLRIVYVEDDERLGALTKQYLEMHAMDVTLVARGDLAIDAIRTVKPDVVVLDVMLPKVNGLELCRRLRAESAVPILLVTARTEEADRVLGLEGGADDYVTKPFSSRELVARIRAQARRARGELGPKTERLTVGSLTLDASTMLATLRGASLPLTTQEYELLKVFAQNAGRVLARERLLELTHSSSSEAFDRSIDVLVSRLRQKLGDDPKNPTILKTVRGAGYLLSREIP